MIFLVILFYAFFAVHPMDLYMTFYHRYYIPGSWKIEGATLYAHSNPKLNTYINRVFFFCVQGRDCMYIDQVSARR